MADPSAQSPRAIVSVFAGRVADTGRDPVPLMAAAVEILSPHPGLELLWASPREILNVRQAASAWVPHHHRDRRPAREARRAFDRDLGRLLAGYGPHVPPRRRDRRLFPVSTADRAIRGGGPDAPDPDDWDHHWDAYGEAAEGNPANVYRCRLVMGLLGRPPAGATVLDIGCGQGEFAIHLRQTYPDVAVWGVEYSAAGVESGRAAAARGAEVNFTQLDLLQPVTLDPGQPAAGCAVCTEVLEHVEDPVLLLRNSKSLLAGGCRVVITVPGGPRSAFDRHIGHYRHFTAADLCGVLTDAGYAVDRVLRAGFPFFNVYKIAVIARGRRLISDVEGRAPDAKPSRAELAATRFFDLGFKHNLDDFPLRWQMAAVARVPEVGR